ncbi:GTP pyrophosphokinase [Pseudoclavibacter sp. 8L]|uniref:GTP pyrophosphokinase n=1 Tax=Pseudoclavibacter sp. 8L TaxID=2653162 RepID=UPI0013567CBF|nr:RelA/SpoT domain-containing protein [Pseudoclavibacter sp. 8L]
MAENENDNEDEYSKLAEPRDALGRKVQSLIEEVLRGHEVKVHAARYRVKSRKSATRKMQNSGGEYETLADLHDLLGLRVIVYFPDQVDRVSEILQGEFTVVQVKDKRTTDDPRIFGYASVHLKVSTSGSRLVLPEWARFKDVVFEIQIRTILQHAWAEIEHDMGYQGDDVPAEFTRTFSAISGALELLDRNFQQLRIDLEVDKRQKESAVSKSENLPISANSIRALVLKQPFVREMDAEIRAKLGVEEGPTPHVKAMSRLARHLKGAGFEDTDSVLAALRKDRAKLVDFSVLSRERATQDVPDLSPGSSLNALFVHTLLTQHGVGRVAPDAHKVFHLADDVNLRVSSRFVNAHAEVFEND